MILSDLMGLPVESDGKRIGYVADARFEVESDSGDVFGDMVLVGIIVSQQRSTSSLGYERSGVNSPWIIARFLAWRHRGSFLVGWDDIEMASHRVVTVRAGVEKRSSQAQRVAVARRAHLRPHDYHEDVVIRTVPGKFA